MPHIFHRKEDKKQVPGDFLEKRAGEEIAVVVGVCPQCGEFNWFMPELKTAHFCTYCGAALEEEATNGPT